MTAPEPGDTIPVSGDLTITEVTQRHYLGTVGGHAALWPRPDQPVLTDEQWRALDGAKVVARNPKAPPAARQRADEIIADLGPLAARCRR